MLRTTSRKTAAAVTAGVAALGLALAAAGPAAAVQPRTAPAAGTVRPDPNGRHTAVEIHRFLTGFYGRHGPSSWSREHQVSDYLKDRAAHTPDYDLLLCAQNTPRKITVGKVTTAQSAGVGWATVTTYWDGGSTGSFTAYVGLDSRPIELQDVDCGW